MQFALHRGLPTFPCCHMEAFVHFGGVPREILYYRRKTAVLREADAGEGTVYNAKLLACETHFGFLPCACHAYRAKIKGKVERLYRYIRADFFMARSFEDIDDMNWQLRDWFNTVANVLCHGTTGRIVIEHFREEQPQLQRLPARRVDTELRVERRVSHEGCVSFRGNYYSVPDGTWKRVLDAETTPDTVLIIEDGSLIRTHARLNGRRERSVLANHRLLQRVMQREKQESVVRPPGHAVAQQPLAIFDLIGRQIGGQR